MHRVTVLNLRTKPYERQKSIGQNRATHEWLTKHLNTWNNATVACHVANLLNWKWTHANKTSTVQRVQESKQIQCQRVVTIHPHTSGMRLCMVESVPDIENTQNSPLGRTDPFRQTYLPDEKRKTKKTRMRTDINGSEVLFSVWHPFELAGRAWL